MTPCNGATAERILADVNEVLASSFSGMPSLDWVWLSMPQYWFLQYPAVHLLCGSRRPRPAGFTRQLPKWWLRRVSK